jgi:membrane dipeptidase
MDGGLGREQIPQEIQTSADLIKVAEALTAAGFSQSDIDAVMGENWLRFFKTSLR